MKKIGVISESSNMKASERGSELLAVRGRRQEARGGPQEVDRSFQIIKPKPLTKGATGPANIGTSRLKGWDLSRLRLLCHGNGELPPREVV